LISGKTSSFTMFFRGGLAERGIQSMQQVGYASGFTAHRATRAVCATLLPSHQNGLSASFPAPVTPPQR
jgi:hypothetical protein